MKKGIDKKRKFLAFGVALMLLCSMSLNALALGWSTETNGVVQVERKAGVNSRVDLYRDGQDLNMTTTLGKASADAVYVHSFLPYLIEQRGDGSYTYVVNQLDDNGNVISATEQSEAFEYVKPEETIDPVIEAKYENGFYCFVPTEQENCGGYSVEYAVYYNEEETRRFYSTYYTGERFESLVIEEDGYIKIDLEPIAAKFEQAVNRNTANDEARFDGEQAFLAVSTKALSADILTWKSAEGSFIVAPEDVFAKKEQGSIKTDVTQYGKKLEDVIVLEIGQTYASVFGEEKVNDVAPVIYNGRTMLPIRFIAEALGATVGWEESTSSVTIETEAVKIALVVGEAQATVNGEIKELDAPSFVDTGRTYLPVRFVAEALGAEVLWDEATRSVIISA